MLRRALVVAVCAFLAGLPLVGEVQLSAQTKLSAAEIVDKNVAARGGLQAWRVVDTMTMSGKMGARGNRGPSVSAPVPGQNKKRAPVAAATTESSEEVQLPFLMELKRPGKMRVEIEFNGQTAVQVFDGKNGWKLRPYLGRNDVEPYTAEEAKGTPLASDLDGPLIDYAAKGNKVELEAIERVEGNDCYKIKVTLKSGAVTHAWINAKTFLEAKMEGQPKMVDGVYHPVEVYYRDYRNVNGLQIPFVLETRVLPVRMGQHESAAQSEKTLIEKVTVNPKLDDALFTKASLEPKNVAAGATQASKPK
jgi:hypothetical protein